MTERKPSIGEVMKANRLFITALLSLPLFGMIIAAALILYKRPGNMYLALGVILFLLVQYGLMVYFLVRRLDSLGERAKIKAEEYGG